jgi:4-aminobutyrate aminotransferase
MAGVTVAPFPYAHYYGWSEDETVDFCLKELRHLLYSQTAPTETAAILIESVLGEGGYVVPAPRFMQGLREICDQHGILLICDEIQSGFGRTGKFFAYEHAGIVPDVMIMAKGIASGLPLSGIAARKELMQKWEPGSHGGTYGGNALACAAATATIKVLKEEKMVENAAKMGGVLMGRLRELQRNTPALSEVRGAGLMIATEFEGDHHGKDIANAVQKACLSEKMLLLTCGTYGNVIRWIPPLNVTEDQINTAVDIFARALDSVAEKA